jgi:sec-independent protein translocase protein TatC
VALVTALVIASPVWIYQVLGFLAPGLSEHERRFLVPILVGTAMLFLAGTVFGYILLSGILRVMFSMFGTQINYLPNASQYLSFVIFFMLVCGLVFEMPIVLLVLVRFGILTPALLRSQRKIAYFILFAFAEIITPVADPFVAPLIVMLPLVVLYEGAIFATRWVVPPAVPEVAGTGG